MDTALELSAGECNKTKGPALTGTAPFFVVQTRRRQTPHNTRRSSVLAVLNNTAAATRKPLAALAAAAGYEIPTITALLERIQDFEARMQENGADKVRLAVAQGQNLADLRVIARHGDFLPLLRLACRLQKSQAFNYIKLAEHPSEVAAYFHSCGISNRTPSIIGALRYISPPGNKPKPPKKIADLETPDALGRFLEAHAELFWQALPLAPTLRAELERRVRALAATLAGKAEHRPTPPRPLLLDLKALPRALALEHQDDGLEA